jgi:3-phenylpropionate/cinnamic acid dioxygenase small subunit
VPIASDESLERLLLAHELTEFLYAEAELLDEGRYEDWLDLLAEDVSYTMPLRLNVAVGDVAERSTTRPGSEVCWFDEGKDVLRKRVAQLRTGVHWAEEPLSRVSHLVTNVRVVSVSVDGGEVTVSCRFVVHRNRVADETDFFVGRRRDTLRRTGDSWRICRRELLLDQNVLLAKNLTLLF